MLVCATTISSWEGLGNAKACMFLGTLCCTVASTSLAAGVSLVSMLQADGLVRVSTPATHYLSTHITTTDLHQNSVQHDVLGLNK